MYPKYTNALTFRNLVKPNINPTLVSDPAGGSEYNNTKQLFHLMFMYRLSKAHKSP